MIYKRRGHQNKSGFPFFIISSSSRLQVDHSFLHKNKWLLKKPQWFKGSVGAPDCLMLPAVSGSQTSQLSGIVSVEVKQVKGYLLNCPPASLSDLSWLSSSLSTLWHDSLDLECLWPKATHTEILKQTHKSHFKHSLNCNFFIFYFFI